MKKLFVYLCTLLISVVSYSQFPIKFISNPNAPKILIGQQEKEVREYLNHLITLSSNPYTKVEKEFDEQGDIILKIEFSLKEAKYFNCNWIMAFFSGTLCIGHTIGFENEFAEENINLLKANFTKYSGNEWRKYIPNVSSVFIQALLTKDDPFYNIQYLFLNNK